MTGIALPADLKLLIEGLPVGVFLYDRDRRLLLDNPAGYTMYGLPPGTLQPGSDLLANARLLAYRGAFGPGDPEEQAQDVVDYASGGARQLRRTMVNGRAFEVSYVPLPDGTVLICLVDMTATAIRRDEAERAVERLHAALATLRTGFAVFGAARMLMLHNPAFAHLLGLPPTLLHPGLPFAALLEALGTSDHFAGSAGSTALQHQTALDRTQPHRTRRVCANGAVIDLLSDPLSDGGFALSVADVTALAKAEDDRQRRAAMLNSIIRAVPHGIVVFGPDQRVALLNEATNRLLAGAAIEVGESRASIVQRLAEAGEFGGEDARAATCRQMAQDMSVPQSWRRRRPNGTTVDVHTAPLPDGGHVAVIADVTNLVEAQAEAARRAELMASIVSHIPHGVSVYGPDHTLRLVNNAYHEVMDGAPIALGDSVNEIIERRARAGEFGPGDPAAIAALQRGHDNTRPQRRRRTRPNGKTIDIRTAPLPDGGHISVVTDVTGLIEAQAESARRTERLDTIVNHIPHGVAVYGPDRRLVLVNAAYREVMDGAPIAPGESVDEIIERRAHAGEFGPGDPAAIAARQRAYDIARPQMRRRTRPNGKTIDVRTAPLPDGGHISVVTDVTPLVQAEAELARRAAMMDAMLSNIRHGIVLWDRDGRVLAANPAVDTMLGTEPGMFVPGRSLEETIQAALRRGNLGVGPAAEARAHWLRTQDRSRPHQDQRLTRSGRVLEVRSDPIPGGGFVTTYTDVTQTREAEDALRLTASAAQTANTAKSRFLAAMSTGLRTPLNEILAETDRLSHDAGAHRGRIGSAGVDADQVLESCAAMAVSARQLLRRIDQVLDVARLEAGRFDLADDVIDVPAMMGQCLHRADTVAAAAEVALAVALDPGLPSVRADERRLRQAVNHLVDNAIRHSGERGTVTLSARLDGAGDLLIQVRDEGNGIAEADIERAFEPFTQLKPSTADRGAGAGLGLYLSRMLAREHGGELLLDSAPGQGTTATLRIPAVRVLKQRPPAPN